MADEANLSKRERQKARRHQKQDAARAQAARARRQRLLALGVVGLIVVAIVGVLVSNQLAERAQQADQAEAVAAQLDELGCSETTEMPDAGAGHLAGGEVATSPPEALYADRPATSGRHMPAWVISGVYGERIDERYLVHNLEHGYVNLYYDEGADPAEVEELKEFARRQIDGDFQKVVVAPWGGELPDDANFATVAWRFRQLCGEFSADVAEVFLREHHGLSGVAPEKNLAPHLTAADGIDPEAEDGPLLLPPLGGAAPAPGEQPTMEAPAGG